MKNFKIYYKHQKRHINRVNQSYKEGLFAQESCCQRSHVSERIAKANEKRKLYLKSRQERIKQNV